MKRDLALVEKILEAIEQADQPQDIEKLQVDGYEESVVGHHVWLCVDGGLVKGFENKQGQGFPQAVPVCLTWKGHKYLREDYR